MGNITQIRNEAPWAGQPAGNVQVSTTTQTFTYDDLYQLRTATGRTQSNGFTRHRYHLEQEYDELGNITLKDQSSFQESFVNGSWRDDYPLRDQTYRSRYSYDGEQPHTPSQIDERLPNESIDFSRVFTYDASGNQKRTVYRGSDRRELVWNEEDQITRVIRNGQELNQTRYDAQGQKAVHLHRVSGQEETAYLGPHLTIQDGRYVTKHVFVGSERVASKVDPDWFQSPPTLYFHPDHLGSTQYSTQDNQDLVQHDEYFPTGEMWQDDTDSRYELARRYTFTGKELDLHTGLYDFGARRYDARQGQWLSADPAFDGLNLYGYVRNNPVNLVDPSGLSAEHSRQNPIPVAGTGLPEGQNFFQTNDPSKAGYQDAATFDRNSANSPVYEANKNGLPPETAKAIGEMGEGARATTSGMKNGGLGGGGDLLQDALVGAAILNMESGDAIRTEGAGNPQGIPGGNCTDCAGGGGWQMAYLALTAGRVFGGGVWSGYTQLRATRSEWAIASRWGRSGLEEGDWVMKGLPSRWNYILSGKWQPGIGNQFAPFSSGEAFAVPRSSLSLPQGWGLDGSIKGIFGQRRFFL